MSGITMSTALEIFNHPNDLEILIAKKENSSKYSILIYRGPGHNFKMLLSTEPFTEKLEDAVEMVKETLEFIQMAVMGEYKNPESIASKFLNPDGRAIDQSKVLNSDLIRRIIEELRKNQIASTYKMI